MKVITFIGFTERGLSSKVNDFLASNDVEVVDIKYAASLFYMGAMIMYKRTAK